MPDVPCNEGMSGGGDREIDIGAVALSDAAQFLAGRGVDGGERLAGLRILPMAADQELLGARDELRLADGESFGTGHVGLLTKAAFRMWIFGDSARAGSSEKFRCSLHL